MPTEERILLDRIALKSRTSDHTILALTDAIKLLKEIHELAKREDRK